MSRTYLPSPASLDRGHAVVISVALLLAASYWSLTATEAHLRTTVRDEVARLGKPAHLYGLRLPMSSLSRFGSADASTLDHASRILLMVLSDDCLACQREYESMARFVSSLPIHDTDRIMIASFRGTDLMHRFESSFRFRQRLHLLRIDHQAAFVVATGISTTPSVAVVDGEHRLQLVASPLRPRFEELVRRTWLNLEAVRPIRSEEREEGQQAR